MRIEAVIFDIGGVLELTPKTGWQDRWAVRLGLAPEEMEARLDPFFVAGSVGELSLAEVEGGIAGALGFGRCALAAFMDDLWAEYLGTLNQPLSEYFTGLRPRYRTGILSNSFVGAREREQHYGFTEMCDEIVYSHEEGLLKPDLRFYQIACQRLGAPAERCVFLDDTPAHVDAGRATGMHALRFVDNDQALRDLGRLLGAPIRAVRTAGALPRPALPGRS